MADNLDDTKDDVFEPNAVNPKIERKLSQSTQEKTQDLVRSKDDADEGEEDYDQERVGAIRRGK